MTVEVGLTPMVFSVVPFGLTSLRTERSEIEIDVSYGISVTPPPIKAKAADF